MNITQNRFLDCIKKSHLIIKKGNFKIQLERCWTDKSQILAMFFNFEEKNRKEYVKIYLNNFRPEVNVYLLNRGERLGINKSGKEEFRDLLIKRFNDYNEFKEYLINLGENISKIEVK